MAVKKKVVAAKTVTQKIAFGFDVEGTIHTADMTKTKWNCPVDALYDNDDFHTELVTDTVRILEITVPIPPKNKINESRFKTTKVSIK